MDEKYEVIGIGTPYEGTNKAGQKYSGFNLFCTYESKHVSGFSCTRLWIPSAVEVPDITVGSVIMVGYNRFGRISRVTVVS